MANEKACAIILAAGEGKRMNSKQPKVLAPVLFKPMLDWVISCVKVSGISDLCVVTGHMSEAVIAHVDGRAETVLQSERLGTGHAVMQAADFIRRHSGENVLILNGDAPLMDSETIKSSLSYHTGQKNAATVISAQLKNPFGYGRIVRDSANALLKITEEKDADEQIRKVREVNSGAYWFNADILLQTLGKIGSNNSQGEYYLTDAIGILLKSGFRADAFTALSPDIVLGANDRLQLNMLNEIARANILKTHMLNGVDIPCADGVMIGPDVKIGRDSCIAPAVIIKGESSIGEDCDIGSGSLVEDSILEDCVKLRAVHCYKSKIQKGADIGPFAHIRPGSVIGKNVHIGDFVEVKNSVIGEKTSISHLSYIGDSDVGSGVNFGCGCVTVNFDGKSKNRTVVEDDAFIGCNTNLIAPVKVGRFAYVAAGSTITDDIPENALAIARAKQVNKESWVEKVKPYREKK